MVHQGQKRSHLSRQRPLSAAVKAADIAANTSQRTHIGDSQI
jgi:hypothetical protein